MTNTIADGNPTCIYSDNTTLSFSGEKLATREEYELADRCVGSVFATLQPGENVKLEDGCFILDDDLDLVQDWQII
ncbi:hypothetical protein FD723_40125 (plasmid) [Nostoc sp. C052]|uniref:hypothetical protein n=1 Tax=Nostoc sp. C052 TaxID=2576902 RepID=UPI0015C2DE1C|nr:hypothetical protein [Nostoc sp. C052]QLE46421.1 hypothetical protein FD723_40125 [Nostoc sp. C052]